MKLNDYFDRVVVINLDRRKDRLAHFEDQTKNLGIDFVRYSAVDAQAFGIDAVTACAQSHRKAIVDAAADGVQRLFIFEDDAEFTGNFNESFAHIATNLPDDWQMLYLGSWIYPTIDIGVEGLKRSEGTILTHAYGMKAEVFSALIEASFANMPIDEAFRIAHAKMNVYVAQPSIVVQKTGISDIRGHFADYTYLTI